MGETRSDTRLQAARAAFRAHDLARAEAMCEAIIRADKRDANAIDLLGQIAFVQGDYERAETLFQRMAALCPREPRPQCVLGEIRTTQGRFAEAIGRFDKALRIRAGHEKAIAGKADALEKSGERDEARALLGPFVAKGRETPEMALIQARLDLRAEDGEALERLVARHADGPAHVLAQLRFLRGAQLERGGRIDEAFEEYRAANAMVAMPFRVDAWRGETDDLIAAFGADRIGSMPRAAHGSQLPVFIVGMPRSGSTLIETIIDAHPMASGCGEFPGIELLVSTISLDIGSTLPYPACAEDLEQADVDMLAARYLERLAAAHPDATRLVDKYLPNYRHLGLIAALVPEARVIHCRRDPLDTCFSCFATPLNPAAHPYTCNLEHLGAVYRDYERLMAHWRSVLDPAMLEVPYEDLVADQERVTRRIIDFCGLPWDDRCLRYYESGRRARTASHDQVDQPIYTSAVGRAQPFEKHFAPLRAML